MRIALLTFVMLIAIVGGAQEQAPTIDEQPHAIETMWLPTQDLPPIGPMIVRLDICPPDQDSNKCSALRAEWQWAIDEADLHALLYRDLHNIKTGQIDYALRNRIAALSRRLGLQDRKSIP